MGGSPLSFKQPGQWRGKLLKSVEFMLLRGFHVAARFSLLSL